MALPKSVLYYFALCMFNLFSIVTHGQVREPIISPPSPESQVLEKFVDQPVDYFRGTPKIDVPIWNIEQEGVSVPISLSYHSGGIRVDEVASSVGLGWALVAGGTISRNVYSSPDDSNVGYIRGKSWLAPDCPDNDFYDKALEALKGDRDWEPDFFTYSFPGGSGKFFFNFDGSVRQLSQTGNKINFNSANGSSFTITAENGVKYLFDKTETSYRSQPFNSAGLVFYFSSWHLTKISFPWSNTSRDIIFAYEPYETVVKYPKSERISGGSYSFNQSIITHTSHRISTISYLGGSVKFNYGEFRHDLQGSQRLQSVDIKDSKTDVIRTFELGHTYFHHAGTSPISNWPATATTVANHNLRLCLISVKERNGSIEKPPYKFSYSTEAWLPDRVASMAVDHWGFFNGKTNNTTFIPNYITHHVGGQPVYSKGGDRTPSEKHCKAGSLNRIDYPTGGHTEYDFGIHQLSPSVNIQTDYEEISSKTYIRQCQILYGTDFTVNNVSGDGVAAKVNLKADYYYPNTQTCGPNSPPPISPGHEGYNRQLHFRIFKVSDLVNPIYISPGQLWVTGETKDNTLDLFLPNGTYRVKVFLGAGIEAVDSDATTIAENMFTLSWTQKQSGTVITGKPVGGLRINEIKTYESAGSIPLHRVFDYKDGDGKEAGRINVIPKYEYMEFKCPNGTCALVTVQSSFSGTDMFYDGVGYPRVTEYLTKEGDATAINGKTVYEYTYPEDHVHTGFYGSNPYPGSVICFNEDAVTSTWMPGSTMGLEYPYIPPFIQSWRRGLLRFKTEYANISGQFQKRSELVNEYKDDYYGDHYKFNPSIDVRATKCATPDPRTPPSIVVAHYFLPSRLIKLISSETKSYDATGSNPVSAKQEYYYDDLNHLQPSRIVHTKSNGQKEVTLSLYPEDFTNTTGFIGEMKTNNVRNTPVETVSYQTDAVGGNVKILSGQLITYWGGTNIGKPAEVRVLESHTPVSLAQFKFSNQTNLGDLPSGTGETAFNISNIDSRYTTPKLSYTYDPSTSRLTRIKNTTNGFSKIYLWDHNQAVPVAEILNAETNQVFYTSFEEGTTGTVSVSRTGTKGYGSSFLVPLPSAGGTYKLTYWKKVGAGKWEPVETTMSSPTTIGGSGIVVDEVRVYPPEATMTTYTYDSALRLKSVTDANNSSSFYDYDDFGRLKVIKDHDTNIVNTYDYHYKGQ